MKKLTDEEKEKQYFEALIYQLQCEPGAWKRSIDGLLLFNIIHMVMQECNRRYVKDNRSFAADETPLEKARKIRNTILNCNDYQNDFGQLESASLDMADDYEAAITRLKASAWTDEDMRYAAYWGESMCTIHGAHYLLNHIIDKWLAQRRAGKGAE